MADEIKKFKVVKAFEFKTDEGKEMQFKKNAVISADVLGEHTEEFVESKNLVEVKPKEVEKPEATVELKRADYDKLMATLERNAKDIDLLYAASDKNRLAKAMNDNGDILIKEVRLWTWDDTGVIVIASKLVSNKSEIGPNRQWVEDQQIQVTLEDGTTHTVPYLEFSRRTLHKIPAEITATTKSTSKDKKESIIFTVQLPDGKTLDINSNFVN